MGWLDIIPSVINAGATIFGASKASSDASDANAANERMVDWNISQGQRAIDLSNEGGDALLSAIRAVTGRMGDFGTFSPENFRDLQQLYLGSKGSERDALTRLTQGGTGVGRQLADQGIRDYQGVATSLGFLPSGSYEAGFAGLAPASGSYRKLVPAGPTAGDYMGDYANLDTPDTDVTAYEGNYDGLIDSLSKSYLDRYSYNTDRTAKEMLADQESDAIRRGLDRSTYDIEAKKGVADVVARRRNDDVLNAVDAAVQEVAKRQGLDSGNLDMRLRELSGGLGRTGQDLAIAAGRTGARTAEYSDRLRGGAAQLEAERAELDARRTNANDILAARRAQTGDTISGYGAASGMVGNAANLGWGNRFNALKEFTGIESGLPNDMLGSRSWAYGDISSGTGLRQGSINEALGMVQAPYQFMLSGSAPAANFSNSALAATNSIAQQANRYATLGGAATGSAISSLASQIPWGSIFSSTPMANSNTNYQGSYGGRTVSYDPNSGSKW